MKKVALLASLALVLSSCALMPLAKGTQVKVPVAGTPDSVIIRINAIPNAGKIPVPIEH